VLKAIFVFIKYKQMKTAREILAHKGGVEWCNGFMGGSGINPRFLY
jgi:hypothetical protein